MCDKEGPQNYRKRSNTISPIEMDDSSPQKDMPFSSRNINVSPTPPTLEEDKKPNNKKVVKYKECLKNHAAAIGGRSTDGCCEFMPSGEDGTLEALMCCACNCHRNFHRKEVDGEFSFDSYQSQILNHSGNRLVLSFHNGIINGSTPQSITKSFISSMPLSQMMVSNKSGSAPSGSDDGNEGGGADIVAAKPVEKVKKRFRTKFTEEQKEKMLGFAEKAGWKMQKLEESAVQQFCQEAGIKRKVLKVWMHNNKNTFGKKNSTS